ncbi:MAG: SH3 domain-containing protein [Massilia sp.]
MHPTRLFASLTLLLASNAAFAFDFRTIGTPVAILYDAPSPKGGKLFVAPRGMPVEVVTTYGDWAKVRDVSGDLAWLDARTLSARRNVVVRVASARVRSGPDDDEPVVFTADKGVLLELVDPRPAAWVRVRHRDGISGYARAADVWGL